MTTQDKWLNLNEDFLVIFVISLGSKKKTECPIVQTTFQLNEDFLVIFVFSLCSKKKTEYPTVQTTFQRLDNK